MVGAAHDARPPQQPQEHLRPLEGREQGLGVVGELHERGVRVAAEHTTCAVEHARQPRFAQVEVVLNRQLERPTMVHLTLERARLFVPQRLE